MSSKKGMIKTEKKIQLLKDIKKILDENQIKYFLTYGTLLGFVRDKQILPWDLDIDIGLWYYDYDRILNLEKKFEKIGYKLIFGEGKYTHVDICFKQDYVRIRDNIGVSDYMPFHAGICFSVKDKDNAIVMQFFDNNFFNRKFHRLKKILRQNYYKLKSSVGVKNKISRSLNMFSIRMYNFLSRIFHSIILFTLEHEVMPNSWFEKLETVRAYGLDLSIPSNSDKYLEVTYGSDWKTPNQYFKKSFSRLNNLAYILLRRKVKYGTKRRKSNAYMERYKIKDQKVKDFWIKRGDISID